MSPNSFNISSEKFDASVRYRYFHRQLRGCRSRKPTNPPEKLDADVAPPNSDILEACHSQDAKIGTEYRADASAELSTLPKVLVAKAKTKRRSARPKTARLLSYHLLYDY